MGIKEDITKIYVGYYDRAPDPSGLNYWIGRANAGMSLSEIAQSFAVQTESTTKYPYLANPLVASADSFVTSVYMNLFNRAPDAAGKAYWLKELAEGKPVGQMIIDIMSGAKDDANGKDLTTLNNKVAVGVDFATDASSINGLDYENNPAAKAAAAAALNGVTDDAATVDAAKAATDAYVATGGGSAPGQTFTLTTALGENIGGTGGSDTITALIDATTPANTTYNTFDVVDGAGGVDTLNLATVGAVGALPSTTQLKGVEILKIAAGATLGAGVVNTSGHSDIKEVHVGGAGSADVTLGAGQTVTLANGTAAGGAITVDAKETDTTVKLDAVGTGQAVTLTGAANTTLTVEGSIGGAGASTITGAATTETLNLELSSSGTLTLAGGALKTIDASKSTGDLDMTGGALPATVETVKGGSGADTITGVAATKTIDGGAGKDTITTLAASTGTVTGGKDMDTITLAGAAEKVVVNAGDTGITLATADDITGFTSGTDTISFGLTKGSATNFLDGGASSSFVDGHTNANTAFDGTVQYFFTDDGTDGWLFVDRDLDGTADEVVELSGVTALTMADVVA